MKLLPILGTVTLHGLYSGLYSGLCSDELTIMLCFFFFGKISPLGTSDYSLLVTFHLWRTVCPQEQESYLVKCVGAPREVAVTTARHL